MINPEMKSLIILLVCILSILGLLSGIGVMFVGLDMKDDECFYSGCVVMIIATIAILGAWDVVLKW